MSALRPDDARRKRSLFAYASLLIGALVLYGLGFVPRGLTPTSIWIGAFAYAAASIAAWTERKLPQLALLTVTALACVTIAEFILDETIFKRNEHNNLFHFDDQLGWRFKPMAEAIVVSPNYRTRVELNGAGFRDRNHSGERPETLVAVIGDSFTSNLGVEMEDVFTTRLNDALGPDVSVRNFGVNGFGQVQELLLLDEVLRDVRPDVVLLLVYTRNDFDDNLGRFDWLRGYERPLARLDANGMLELVSDFDAPTARQSRPRTLYDWVRSTSLSRLIRSTLLPVADEETDPERIWPEIRYGRVPLVAEDRAAFEMMSILLAEFDRRTRESDTRFALIIAPSVVRVYPKRWKKTLAKHETSDAVFDIDQPHRFLAEDSARSGRLHFDLVDVLVAEAEQGGDLYFRNEQHWNARGNQVVAEALAAWLEQSGLLVQSEERQVSAPGTRGTRESAWPRSPSK